MAKLPHIAMAVADPAAIFDISHNGWVGAKKSALAQLRPR
jgi:hypothetical protein